MKSFIFVSPNFPENYENFCIRLKENGVRVLGIGDAPYDSLTESLRGTLTEYYRVDSMENYDDMYRAAAFFCFKYGRIDGLESNNEYWLEQDARLRTDFNIPGLKTEDMAHVKRKSMMKECYEKAGIRTARWHLVSSLEESLRFIKEVGYPVVVKPDNGVGAVSTWKISSQQELEAFHEADHGGTLFIMEEFVPAEVYSYDAIIDSQGSPLLETGNHTPVSIMDIVNEQKDAVFYIEKQIADDVRAAGRACVKSFGIRSRFIHLEFFRLTRDHPYLGKKGTLLGLEVNLRPSGGFTPDMINIACHTDVYKAWADMVTFDRLTVPPDGEAYYCMSAGLRTSNKYLHDGREVETKFADQIVMVRHLPPVLAEGMGDLLYLARFDSMEEMKEFMHYVCARR